MAARGEQVNLKDLENDTTPQLESKTTAANHHQQQQQQQQPTNGPLTATNIEQRQQTISAESTANSSIPSQVHPVSAPPVTVPNAPLASAAMPQALLGSGTYHISQQDLSQVANGVCSARRRLEESHDELVLRWLLHRLARRPAEGLCQHAGGWMKL